GAAGGGAPGPVDAGDGRGRGAPPDEAGPGAGVHPDHRRLLGAAPGEGLPQRRGGRVPRQAHPRGGAGAAGGGGALPHPRARARGRPAGAVRLRGRLPVRPAFGVGGQRGAAPAHPAFARRPVVPVRVRGDLRRAFVRDGPGGAAGGGARRAAVGAEAGGDPQRGSKAGPQGGPGGGPGGAVARRGGAEGEPGRRRGGPPQGPAGGHGARLARGAAGAGPAGAAAGLALAAAPGAPGAEGAVEDAMIDPGLEDYLVEQLAAFASAQIGFAETAIRPDAIRKVLREELRLGGGTLDGLVRKLLEQDARVLGALWSAVLVGETYFFRQVEHFEWLASLTPALALEVEGPIRAWSAGCSTGEEAYSIAACFLAALHPARAEVLGTDISPASLQTARAGTYSRWSSRQSSPPLFPVHQMVGPDRLQVLPEVQALTRFVEHNL